MNMASLWLLRFLFGGMLCLFARPLAYFGRPFLLITGCIFVLTFLWRNRFQGTERSDGSSQMSLWGGLGLVCLSLVLLEVLEPRYFFRADNKVLFFPVMTYAAQSFFQGVFPTWNPYQFLGEPLIGTPFFGLTYPFVYLAYAIAHYLLGEDQLFFNAFAWMHLIPGYFVMCRLLDREFGVQGWLMSLSASTFVLGGFGLICGRDWYYMTPLIFWIPLVFLAYSRWFRQPSIKAGTFLGVAVALMLHSGNVQMCFYWTLLLGVGGVVLALMGGMTRPHLRALVVAIVVFTVVASPCLVPQLLFSAGSQYPGRSGEGILHRLNALFLPAPLVNAPHPLNWGNYSGQSWTPFFFVGYVSILAAIAGVCKYALSLWRFDNSTHVNPLEIHLIWMFIVAFGFSLGSGALFWQVFQYFPVVNRFNRPFKFLSFLSFFVPLLGAIFFKTFVSSLGSKNRKLAFGMIYGGLVLSLAVHVSQARATYDYFQGGEFPKKPSILSQHIDERSRIVSLSPLQPVSDHYFDTLPHNLATTHRIYSIGGDDIFTETHEESNISRDISLWREYGVRWVLASKAREKEALQSQGAQKIYSDDHMDLYEIPNPEAMAQIQDKRHRIKSFQTHANGMTVLLDRPLENATTLHLNFLWRREMAAQVDRPGGAAVPIEKDSLKRMRIALQPGLQAIRLEYYPIFRFGYWLVIVLLILMIWVTIELWRPRLVVSIPLRIPEHANQFS